MSTTKETRWRVGYSAKARKQREKLPQRIREILDILSLEIEKIGPYRKNWSHFSDLGDKNVFHCHLKNGRPNYVACWLIQDKKTKVIEIYYVGTHENAPY